MIRLRATEESDLPALESLFLDRFGHRFDAETWRWKYRRLPGRARSRVAVDGAGRVVAHAGALAFPARWSAGRGDAWQLVDFAGTPRGAGMRPPLVALGRQLLEDLPGADDLPWIFGFPSPRHFRLGQRTFGYQPIGERVPWAGEIPASAPAGRASLVTGESCGDEAAEVWRRCAVHGVERTAAFLNWRYHARPGRYYRFYRLRASGAEGLLVFAFVENEAWAAEAWLPERAADGGGPEPVDWYDALLAAAADLRASGIVRWRFWPPPTPALAATLARLQLSPLPREAVFLGWRGRCEPESDFYYAMGDYDAV